MAESIAIAFGDIKVGDRIRVTYTDEDFSRVKEGIVYEVDDYYVYGRRGYFLTERHAEDHKIELLDRPKPVFRVGDVVTQEQFAQLPQGTLGTTTGDDTGGHTYPVWFLEGEHYIGRIPAQDVYGLYGDVEILVLPGEEEDILLSEF